MLEYIGLMEPRIINNPTADGDVCSACRVMALCTGIETAHSRRCRSSEVRLVEGHGDPPYFGAEAARCNQDKTDY
jgi:hypothetical protein